MAELPADLFAPGPARDPRFTVRDIHGELRNFLPDDPQATVEFLHRQMNEEVDGLEMSARNLTDFPDAPWELRLAIARQCSDEARHVAMFRRCLEARGGRVGQYPVMNFQYRILMRIGSLIGRLAVQNRSFEAAGLDAIQQEVRSRSAAAGEDDLAALFDWQLADELQHVRYANAWIPKLKAAAGPRALLDLARAVSAAGRAIVLVAGDGAMTSPVALDLRREAGFTDEEIEAARELIGREPAPQTGA